MKKSFLYISLVSAIVLCLTACKGGKQSQPESEDLAEPMETTMMDTVTVTSLVDQYLESLHDKDLDNAISMLYYLREDGTIEPLSGEMAAKQRDALKPFLGKDFKIDNIIFYQETDSQVKFTCTLFEKEEGDPRPNKISFLIRPMRISGSWYLTMADTHTDTVESKIDKYIGQLKEVEE